jgi:8-oxo-dGTP diphosphatase
MQLKTRPLSGEYLIGASCHNAEELRQAERVGCDFVVLGPVLQTTSHPGTEPMGWSIFRSLVNRCRLPVYALGGLQPEDISTARSVGAQGLSMISGIWQAPDLASAVKRAMGLLVE